MSIIYTKEQQEAIDIRDKNIIVSAAAGSGKTRVLVDRVIKLILSDRKDISNMIIVTFTNKASIEMKDRIKEELTKKLKEKDSDKKYIIDQLNKLPKAHIQTLHSFASDTIRENFYFFDNLNPNFSIITGNQSIIMKKDAIDLLFDEEYEKIFDNDDFKMFLENFSSGRSDDKQKDIIIKTYEFLQSEIRPFEWFKEKIDDNSSYDKFKEVFLNEYKEILFLIKNTLDDISLFNIKEKKISIVEDDLKKFEKAYSFKDNRNKFIEEVSNISFTGQIRSSKDEDSYDVEELRNRRNIYKEAFKELQKKVFNKDDEILSKLKVKENKVLNELYVLTKRFADIYTNMKKEKNALDFNDIEHRLIELLDDENIRNELRKKYKYIFFDEYQDSNSIQNYIIDKLKSNDNLFFVGDVKQSIYKFRLANPELFLEKLEDYKNDSNSKRIDLNRNFRTDKDIIEFNNFIFDRLMTKEISSIDYKNGNHRLYSDLLFENKNPKVEINILDKSLSEETSIAYAINNLIMEGYDYKDIAILFRTSTNISDYTEKLKEFNIPYFSDMEKIGFENIEIDFFIKLLKIIANKKDDMNLLSVIISEIFNFNEDEILKIKLNGKIKEYQDFYECFYNYDNEDHIKEKINFFTKKIDEYNIKLKEMSLFEFGYYIFEDSGYYNFLLSRDRSKERIENVDKIISQMEEYERVYDNGLYGFLNYVDDLKKGNNNISDSLRNLSENENLVRLMTIHKSKGLEFPVVIIANANKSFSNKDKKADILFDDKLGIGISITDFQKKIKISTPRKSLILDRIDIENKREEMRVLYVAMTRAINKMIISGKYNLKEEKINNISKETNYLNLNSYMDWIISILSKDKIFGEDLGIDKKTDNFKNKDIIKINKIESLDELDKEDIKSEFYEVYNSYNYDKDCKNLIEDILLYKYPNLEDTKTSSKKSVTEIAKNFDNRNSGYENTLSNKFKEMSFDIPDFYSKKNINAADRGSIIHTVFQNLSIKNHTIDSIKEEINNMVKDYKLLEEELEIIDYDKILNFFENKLTKYLIENSSSFRKEESFLMKESDTYINGQIDIFCEIDNEIILIDIKTDSTKNNKNSYKNQLNLYAKALENALDKKVSKMFLYWYEFGEYEQIQKII
ncbi:MAG: helicase-exonuclease AddAB subunit AddA [Tissierellia bacterium]|nr:helicase-exonuclease AddAB subunit AddA [Tissierellia bacterium]